MSNPEGMPFQPEISESKKEFPPNKKRKLSEVWASVVLGVDVMNEQNIEGLTFVELRNLLNKQHSRRTTRYQDVSRYDEYPHECF